MSLSALIVSFLATSSPVAAQPTLSSVSLVQRESLSQLDIDWLGYAPNVPVAIVGLVVYSLVAAVQTAHHFRKGARYMLAMTIGLWVYAVGLVFRLPLRSNPTNLGIYLVSDICIVLAPCAFIGSLYALVGQMARRLGTADFFPVRADKIAWYFVWSDIITVNIQGDGSGLEVNPKIAKIGADIFLAGLILQLVSFLVFIVFAVVWASRVRTRAPHIWESRSWRPLLPGLFVACVCIIVRSIFRTIESIQGFHGFLSTHEVYFWCLDALPLAVATAIFAVIWPENHLPRGGSSSTPTDEAETVELKERAERH